MKGGREVLRGLLGRLSFLGTWFVSKINPQHIIIELLKGFLYLRKKE